MVLTAAQQAAFFTNQMLVPAATRLQMVTEGVSTVQDLLDYNENMLDSLEDRLRKPGQGIAPFVFSPVTKNRLLQASQLMKYYNAVGRPVTVPSIQYAVIKSFYLQFKALQARKKEDPPEVPKITKNLPITKWSESWYDFLNKKVGVCYAPLAYVVRADDAVPAIGPQATDHPHSTEHGSVEAELVARISHAYTNSHPFQININGLLRGVLENGVTRK